MNKSVIRWVLYLSLIILYLLHNDLWFWDNPSLILGLPVGLFYHLMFCIAASLLMFLVVSYAWPEHFEVEKEKGSEQ
ncbi:MAG: hypothetical protein V3U73_12665 [bacterium]